jgi:hypothetical protein
MLLDVFGAYAALGVVVATIFAVFGVSRTVHAPVTWGARILMLPGAVAFWPLVLRRWIEACGRS